MRAGTIKNYAHRSYCYGFEAQPSFSDAQLVDIPSITVSITEGTSSDHPSVMEMGSAMCQRFAVPNDQQLFDHETMSFGL